MGLRAPILSLSVLVDGDQRVSQMPALVAKALVADLVVTPCHPPSARPSRAAR